METQVEGTLLATMPTRCVIVVDKALAAGHAANAAAVIALTIGQRHPALVGAPAADGSGFEHPGLITIAMPVLGAAQEDLPSIRRKGLEAGCDVVDFPVEGQQTTNYDEYREAVAALEPESLRYVGVALIGQKKEINKIVGYLPLLR